MNHDELRQALSQMLDNELDASARVEVQSHLEICGECAGAYRRLERLATLFQAPVRASAADTEIFVGKVMRRLRPTPQPAFDFGLWTWLSPRWLTPALTAGVASVFLSIAGHDLIAPIDDLFSGPSIVADEELDLAMEIQ